MCTDTKEAAAHHHIKVFLFYGWEVFCMRIFIERYGVHIHGKHLVVLDLVHSLEYPVVKFPGILTCFCFHFRIGLELSVYRIFIFLLLFLVSLKTFISHQYTVLQKQLPAVAELALRRILVFIRVEVYLFVTVECERCFQYLGIVLFSSRCAAGIDGINRIKELY